MYVARERSGEGDDYTTCPVCSQMINGSAEELNEHVERCLNTVNTSLLLQLHYRRCEQFRACCVHDNKIDIHPSNLKKQPLSCTRYCSGSIQLRWETFIYFVANLFRILRTKFNENHPCFVEEIWDISWEQTCKHGSCKVIGSTWDYALCLLNKVHVNSA